MVVDVDGAFDEMELVDALRAVDGTLKVRYLYPSRPAAPVA